MDKRFLSVFIFAIVISGLATAVIYRLVLSWGATAKPVPTQAVIVAAHNLDVGALVKDGDLSTVSQSAPLPSGALTKKEDIVGRGVISQIYQEEAILDSRLAPKGAGAGLAAMIPQGKRAVAVRVNDIAQVAGFVIPGSHVDVLISGVPPNNPQAAALGTQTKTLLQDMEVLSAGQNIQKDAEGKPVSVPVVNMLATPEQAEILSLAGNDTRIQLVLRNPLDNEQAKPPGTVLANLYTGGVAKPAGAGQAPRPKPRVVAPPPPPPPADKPAGPVKIPLVIEVFTGTRRVDMKFEKTVEAGK